MRSSPKSYLCFLAVLLFVSILVLVPGGTSANGDKEKETRDSGDRRRPRDRESASETALALTRNIRPIPVDPPAARPGDKSGILKRLGGFFKRVFVPFDPKVQTTDVDNEEEDDADLPAKGSLRNRINKEEYQALRSEYIASLRGLDLDRPFAIGAQRSEAINLMNDQLERIGAVNKRARPNTALGFADWSELGPTTLPNGQYQGGLTGTVSGRATTVVVDPTDSNTIYLGTAQGGVWRSTNGGLSWTSIFDSAQSLAIGALALAPSSPTTLYVGTGEPNNSADSFFGVGVYRIDNAKTTATLNGPINPLITTGTTTALTYNCFNGRSITKILVDPGNAATIFVSTAAGVAGAGGNALSNTIPPLALRGVFRSTNATAAPASVTFSKLIVNTDGSLDAPGTGNTSIFDMVLDPGFDGGANQTLLVSTSGSATGGVIMRSTNALAASPTFTQTLFPGFNGLVMKLAINQVGAVVTVYVATNEPSSVAACSSASQAGRVRKSVDGGVTWGTPLTAAEGYCGGQCSYDNPVAVDPTDANIVYLAGNARGTCSDVMKRSADGGTTFTRDDTNLHADAHYIFIDPNVTPHKVWFANDGGIYSRIDAAAGTAWTSNNNAPLGTFQFVSLAVHPTDQNFTIGGTQDNGTEAQQTTPGNWTGAEGGDGGFALIDQSATDTGANVKAMYHTFFNLTNSLIGFDRTELGSCLSVKNSWEFRGAGGGVDATPSCDGTAFAATNGLNIADTVLFYAPMALGPGGVGNPNTLYFGTNKLYRSTDRGDTMTIVSQNPLIAGVAVSAIGISPTDDNVRIVGMRNGNVFATTTGSTTLTNTAFPFPANATASATNRHIGRAVIDPANSNTAYVTLSYYTNPATAGQIWRTTNLNSATPTWTSIGNTGTGLPNIPVNAFAVDANDPTAPGVSVLYAGTDIGVYHSRDSGATWLPFGQGLPRVAVFDMAIQPTSRMLRIATHGRGMWEKLLPGNPTAAPATISGAVTTRDGAPLAGATLRLSGARSAIAITDSDGRYQFGRLEADNFYTVTPELANYQFSPANHSFSLVANKTDAVFTALPDALPSANPIDTNEYFVRQQYLDFLGREPDEDGLLFWAGKLNQCNGDAACLRVARVEVSAAFFQSEEFGDTGSYVYRLYQGVLERQLSYNEFATDRQQVVGGANLAASKAAFASTFVTRPEFMQKYQGNTTGASFVDALLQTLHDTAGVDLSGERANLLSRYNGGSTLNEGRALVMREVGDNALLISETRNPSFVLMEYFGYLRRGAEAQGYAFWLNVLNTSDKQNYRGMVCSFLTSAEYQLRFGSLVTRTNADCGQ